MPGERAVFIYLNSESSGQKGESSGRTILRGAVAG